MRLPPIPPAYTPSYARPGLLPSGAPYPRVMTPEEEEAARRAAYWQGYSLGRANSGSNMFQRGVPPGSNNHGLANGWGGQGIQWDDLFQVPETRKKQQQALDAKKLERQKWDEKIRQEKLRLEKIRLEQIRENALKLNVKRPASVGGKSSLAKPGASSRGGFGVVGSHIHGSAGG